jgi:uncharacterized membrane protein YfcA
VVEYPALLVLGVLVGAFGTLVGAGGGFLLVPILLLLYPDLEPDTVTAMSLLVVFVNASSGSVAYARQKRIDFWSGGWFALRRCQARSRGRLRSATSHVAASM